MYNDVIDRWANQPAIPKKTWNFAVYILGTLRPLPSTTILDHCPRDRSIHTPKTNGWNLKECMVSKLGISELPGIFFFGGAMLVSGSVNEKMFQTTTYLEDGLPVDVSGQSGSPPIYKPWSEFGHLEGVPRCPSLRGRKQSPWLLTTYKSWGDPPSNCHFFLQTLKDNEK